MTKDLVHIFYPPFVGVMVTISSYVLDAWSRSRLRRYLLEKRRVNPDQTEWICRLAEAIAILSTYYANVVVLVTNCVLAFVVFPAHDAVLVACVLEFTVMLLALKLIWLSQFSAIDIAQRPMFDGGAVIGVWLRREEVAFNVSTIMYFLVGYWRAL